MTRLFEKEYRLTESADILAAENRVHASLDMRIHNVEEIAEEFRTGNRLDVDALLASINDTIAEKVAQLDEFVEQYGEGVSAALVTETADRRFTSNMEIASISGRITVVEGHAARTDNPHGVTAAQIGAPTSAAVTAALAAHSTRTDNPHGVTAAQVGTLTAEAISNGLNERLPKAGGTMTGILNMSDRKITSLGDPTGDNHAVSRGYSDARYVSLTADQTVNGLKTFGGYSMHRGGVRSTESGEGNANPGANASVGCALNPLGITSSYNPNGPAGDFGRGTDGAVHRFWFGSTNVASISVTAAGAAYNTASDEALKQFIGEYDPDEAIAIIRADPVRDWYWTPEYGGGYAIGWGAQTSHAISSDLASPGVGAPGDEDYVPWGVDQGKRTPYLWAAMTRVLDRLDALEARLNELETE